MSRKTDEERKEEAVANRIESAKDKLRMAQVVLTDFVQEEPRRTTARKLGVSSTTVWRLRVWLGLEAQRIGQGQHGSKAAIDAVRV